MKDLDNLLKQAQEMQQKLQQQMQKASEDQKKAEYRGESGAGLVKVILNGNYVVKTFDLDAALLKEDKETIEDLLAAAVNDALRKVAQNREQDIAGLGAGFELLKDLKFPF